MVNWLGAKVITIPGLMIPVSTMAASPDLIDLGLRTITWAVKSLAPCGLVLGVGGDISTLDILGRDVLGVEFNIVSGDLEGGEVERLVVEDGEVERLVVEDGEVAILESEVDKFENIMLNDV